MRGICPSRATDRIKMLSNPKIALFLIPFACYVSSRLLVGAAVQFIAEEQWSAAMLSLGGHVDIEKILLSVLFIPLIEELFFRKLIFDWIKKKFSLPTAYILSVSVFLSAHLISTQYIFLLNILILGMVCQYVYLKTNNIWPAVYIHSMFNLLVLIPKASLHELLTHVGASKNYYGVILFSLAFISISIQIIILRVYTKGYARRI